MTTELVLSAIAQIGLGIGLPTLVGWIGTHVKDQVARNTINSAVSRAAGIAYDYLTTTAAGTSSAVARDQALRQGVQYLASAIPDTLQAYGVDDNRIRQLVQGELGKLLVGAPSVEAGGHAKATEPETAKAFR